MRGLPPDQGDFFFVINQKFFGVIPAQWKILAAQRPESAAFDISIVLGLISAVAQQNEFEPLAIAQKIEKIVDVTEIPMLQHVL